MHVHWKIIPFIGIAAAIVSCSRPAHCQSDLTGNALTLQQCIELAASHQIDLLKGKQQLVGAKAKLAQEQSVYFPQVTAAYTPFDLSGTSNAGSNSVSGATLTARQTIYDGGLREAQVKAAKANLTQQEATLLRIEQTVTYNITVAYFNALRARHLAEVSEMKVKALEAQLQMAQARIAAGETARVDELPIKAQLANARVDQLAARNAVSTTLVKLQSTIGLPAQPTFTIMDIDVPTNFEELKVLDVYIQSALTTRPDVIARQAILEAAKATVSQAKINTQPRLVSDGQYTLASHDGLNSNWSVSAGIVYDLFDGRRNKAILDNARASQVIAIQEATELQKAIQAQVQEAYLNVNSARERIAAADMSAQASQQNAEAQEARYREGLATTLDLLNAQVDVASAHANAVGASYDYYVAFAQLEYAIGAQGGFNAK